MRRKSGKGLNRIFGTESPYTDILCPGEVKFFSPLSLLPLFKVFWWERMNYSQQPGQQLGWRE
jgi:hypothetical protein